MSLADLFNIPRNRTEQGIWTFANAQSHLFIINALQIKHSDVSFFNQVLDPLNEADVERFLLGHQYMHNQLDLLLGIGGNDYSTLDPTKPASLEIAWIQHAQEHIQAETQLRSGS